MYILCILTFIFFIIQIKFLDLKEIKFTWIFLIKGVYNVILVAKNTYHFR